MYAEYRSVRNYFESINELLKTPMTMQDIFLAATSKRYKRKKALTFQNDKGKIQSIKYKHYRVRAFEMGSRLDEALRGIQKGSVVALKAKNSYKWPLIFWGLLMCGYVPFLMDAKLPKENAEHLLEESKAQAIVTTDIVSYSKKTIQVDSLESIKINFRFAEKWANEVIFSSSGTTGNVKLMVYNGKNLCSQIAAAYSMPETTGDIMYAGEINILAMLPFHHIFGFVAVFLWYTFFGKNIVFIKDMSPKEVMGMSQKCGVTHVYSVPLFWDMIAQNVLRKAELEGGKKAELLAKMIAYNTKKITVEEAGLAGHPIAVRTVQDQLLGHKIKFLISGGGYISEETLNVINGIGYPLYNGYGMTEAGVTSVELSPKVVYRLKGSIGRPLHGVEYKIENTNPLHPNLGELLIKSPITHVREIINGVEQKATLTEDGYFRTGDIAEVDATGFYFIKGRIKDVIINENGENIYPDEIESYFEGLKHINHLTVFGFKKGKSTHEDITLVLELSNDCLEEQLKELKENIDNINASLANEKKVARVLIYKDKLPLTASMKVKRFQVKEQLKNNPNMFATFDEKKEVKSFDGFTKEEVEPVVIKMREIFAKILILPIIKIEDNAHWINDLGGDSMSYVELINTINSEFGISIPEEKYGKLENVNDFAYEVLVAKKK